MRRYEKATLLLLAITIRCVISILNKNILSYVLREYDQQLDFYCPAIAWIIINVADKEGNEIYGCFPVSF